MKRRFENDSNHMGQKRFDKIQELDDDYVIDLDSKENDDILEVRMKLIFQNYTLDANS